MVTIVFFFQAEDGIRDLVRSRGLGDVYKRQSSRIPGLNSEAIFLTVLTVSSIKRIMPCIFSFNACLLYTSDAADERSSVDLGGRRIIKKKIKVQLDSTNKDDRIQIDIDHT